MPLQRNHPSQHKHCSDKPDRAATQLSHHRKELISLSLMQGGSTAMLAGATLSYHCHCSREGVLPWWQVPLSNITVISAGRDYCHAGGCPSLMSLSLLQGGSTAMRAGATLTALVACCSNSTLLSQECDSTGSHLGYLSHY